MHPPYPYYNSPFLEEVERIKRAAKNDDTKSEYHPDAYRREIAKAERLLRAAGEQP